MWSLPRGTPFTRSCVECHHGSTRYRYSDSLIAMLTPAADRQAGEPGLPSLPESLTGADAESFTECLLGLHDRLRLTQIEFRAALVAYNADPCDVELADAVTALRQRDTRTQSLITDIAFFLLALSDGPVDGRLVSNCLQGLSSRVAALDERSSVLEAACVARNDVRRWSRTE